MSETAAATIAVDRLEGGRVLRGRLNQPKANVLTGAMMREIRGALSAHGSDPSLKLAIIRGTGGQFSFGASVEEHRRDQVAGMLRTFHALIRDVASYPVPVAALVEGRCLGGAFELVLACHIVHATATATFACPEITLGVFPPVLAAIGARRLGGPLAERLMMTGESLDAVAAERAGLVARVVAPSEDPEAAMLAWYREHLAPLSAFAIRQAVRAGRLGSGLIDALGAPLDALERRYLDEVVASRDGNEGIEAFLARRAPVWRDA